MIIYKLNVRVWVKIIVKIMASQWIAIVVWFSDSLLCLVVSNEKKKWHRFRVIVVKAVTTAVAAATFRDNNRWKVIQSRPSLDTLKTRFRLFKLSNFISREIFRAMFLYHLMLRFIWKIHVEPTTDTTTKISIATKIVIVAKMIWWMANGCGEETTTEK